VKRLKRIQLINWHRFTHHTFDVDGNLLLMGDNGSGKSTILDALQVGLVGNMRSVRLNLAANEGGDRSLKSYVLGLVGAGNNGHPARTLRKNATSYILLEFADSETEDTIVLGTVIDAHADGRTPEKEHFLAQNVSFEEIPCLDKNHVPRRVREFKREIAPQKNLKRYARVEDYQQAVLKQLGGLDPEFFRLFVSGMAFRKIRNLRDFVYDFLLPEAPDVQVVSLREAAERYRQLHELSQEADERIDLLDRIVANAENAEAGQKECDQLRASIDRARLALCEKAMQSAEENRDRCREELTQATNEHTQCEAVQKTARDRLNRLQQDLIAHQQHSAALAIENRVERLADQIRHENRDSERLQAALQAARSALASWRELIGKTPPLSREQSASSAKSYREELCEAFSPAVVSRFEDFEGLAADCLAGEIPPEDRRDFVRQVAEDWPAVSHWLQSRQFQVESRLDSLESESQKLKQELQDLQEGHRPLPPAVLRFKEHLQSAGLSPLAFCEVIEVGNPALEETIESVLGQRRYDILVSPEEFESALKVFRELSNPEFADAALIDTPRLMESASSPVEGSLAQAVHSANPLAKRYADALLGRTFTDGRNRHQFDDQSTVVTEEGFLIGGYSIRKLASPAEHRSGQIGGGLSGRREDLQSALEDCQKRKQEHRKLRDEIESVHELFDRGRRGAELLAEDYDLPRRLQDVRAEYRAAREEAAALKQSDLGELRRQVEQAETDEHEAGKKLKHAWGRQCVAEQSLANAESALNKAEEELTERKAAYETDWPAESEIAKSCEQFAREQPPDAPWNDWIRDWTEELASLQKSFSQRHDDGVRLRTEYNNRFQFTGDCLAEDVHEYAAERARWVESELPSYGSRLQTAKDTARQVLEEEVIHRLRERLRQVERQFRELNQALSGLNFSGRRYRFTYSVRREYEPFYDMIVAAEEIADEPLHQSDWHARFAEGPLQDLLDDVLGSGGNRALANLEQCTDYRAYFDYDIEITEADGSVHAFSHVAGSGSGGETQTPYYVAMLASLARLYRTRGSQSSQAALVAFDEPFQKMDESNIAATLRLARRLGLQVLLATPKDRCHQLLPAIGTATCLLVLRDGNKVLLEPFQRIGDDPAEPRFPQSETSDSRLTMPTTPKTVK